MTATVAKRPRIDGVAYNGGAIPLPNYPDPVVIDLAGLTLPKRIALLLNHVNATSARVGAAIAVNDGKTLTITGEVTATSTDARHVVEQGDWALSIGAEPLAIERVKVGKQFTANGREFTGPLVWIKSARLREISIVAVGADADANATIAASWNLIEPKGKTMPVAEAATTPEVDAVAILKAERERVMAIREMCGHRTKLADDAISLGWDMDYASRQLLREVNSEKPVGNRLAGGYRPIPWDRINRDDMLTSLFVRAGCPDLAVAAVGKDSLERVQAKGPARFAEIARLCLMMDVNGDFTRPYDNDESLIRAAFSTAVLPNILDTFVRRNLEHAYNEAPSVWRTFSAIRSAQDFRPNESYRLSSMEPLERVAKGGEVKHGTLGEEPAIKYEVDTFAQLLTLDRKMLVNDDLSSFAEIARLMAVAAGRTLDDLVWDTILTNFDGHFSEANNNLLTGPDSALSEVSLGKAITKLMCQKDSRGRVIGLDAHVLVVPPELLFTAKKLLESEFMNTVAGNLPDGVLNVPSKNVLRNSVQLACEPRISQMDHTDASPKRWYLFAKPLHLPAVTAFLDGRQTPSIKALGIDDDLNYLAYGWRVFHDFGFALGDPRAAIMSVGK